MKRIPNDKTFNTYYFYPLLSPFLLLSIEGIGLARPRLRLRQREAKSD